MQDRRSGRKWGQILIMDQCNTDKLMVGRWRDGVVEVDRHSREKHARCTAVQEGSSKW
jgi:hypothetical protein